MSDVPFPTHLLTGRPPSSDRSRNYQGDPDWDPWRKPSPDTVTQGPGTGAYGSRKRKRRRKSRKPRRKSLKTKRKRRKSRKTKRKRRKSRK